MPVVITLEMVALIWSFVFKFTFVPWYVSWTTPRLPYHFCWRSRNRRPSRTQSVTETIAFTLHFHQSRTRMWMQQSLLDASPTVVQAVVAYLSLDQLSYCPNSNLYSGAFKHGCSYYTPSNVVLHSRMDLQFDVFRKWYHRPWSQWWRLHQTPNSTSPLSRRRLLMSCRGSGTVYSRSHLVARPATGQAVMSYGIYSWYVLNEVLHRWNRQVPSMRFINEHGTDDL